MNSNTSSLSKPEGDTLLGGTPSLTTRVLGVFGYPSRLFRSFDDATPWVGPLAISIAVGVLVIVALPDHVLYEGMQGATTRRGVPVEITSSPGIVAAFERARLSMGVVATQPVLAVLVAGSLMLVFGQVLRWPAEFRPYFVISTHSFLISSVGALLALAVQIATSEWTWQPNLGAIVGESAGSSLGAAAYVNPFMVWMLVVLGLGVAAVNARRSAALPVALLICAYGGFLLIRAWVVG